MPDHVSRRRALTILAATAAACVPGPRGRQPAVDYEWTGVVMGADARLVFSGGSRTEIHQAIGLAVAEIDRLENVLSLYRAGSEINRLNRDGIVTQPSLDMRHALGLGLTVARASDGLFDPTVQALWEAHVDWFAIDPRAALPPDKLIAAARQRVDWRRISRTTHAIDLGDGQRITLNGLGQGYVTDRVADLLRRRGFVHVLVDLGEQRALGPRPDGAPWLVAREEADPIALREGAVATSEGRGCIIGNAGKAHHLFDPRTGRSAHHWRRLTVTHRSAALADALSTALYAAAPQEIHGVLKRFPGTQVRATDCGHREWHWETSSEPASHT